MDEVPKKKGAKQRSGSPRMEAAASEVGPWADACAVTGCAACLPCGSGLPDAAGA